jgi:D-amino-acid oxidase
MSAYRRLLQSIGWQQVHRRAFLRAGGAISAGFAIGGCAARLGGVRRARVALAPVHVSFDRIIRTTVGLRPFRESGFVVRAERLGDRMLIHNYGHGGAGMSLSWGTAQLVADLALEHTDRQVAVIGCGVVGLTTARMLQRRGFDVTIYAQALPPDTTSNNSWASFTPLSGVVTAERRTPDWDAQFRRAAVVSYRELQLLVGRYYGVSWIDDYGPTNQVGTGSTSVEAGRTQSDGAASSTNPLLPSGVAPGRVVLEPGEHPFVTRYAIRRPTLRFEPSIYLDALMRDVIAFRGRIVVRKFDSPRDLVTLPESLIVNCTGLGSKQLFDDEELTPVKGQLVVLVPQPEVTYTSGGMMPRHDGIVLGHTMERGVWTLDVNEVELKRVVERHMRTFSTMRAPPRIAAALSPVEPPTSVPPVESFFDLES